MQEVAKVIREKENYVTVSLDKKDQCSKCGMCLFPKNAQSISIEAENQVNAKIGDTVLIERTESGKLTAFILVFLVPILLILLSSLIATLVIEKELWILWLSLISCVAWYMVLPFIDKAIGGKLKAQTKVIKILNESKENENE